MVYNGVNINSLLPIIANLSKGRDAKPRIFELLKIAGLPKSIQQMRLYTIIVYSFFGSKWEKGGYKVKKFICTVLTIVLVVGLFVPTSFAATNQDYKMIVSEVEETNEKIEELIEEAIEDAEEVLSSNKSQSKIDKEITKIIEKLVKETDKIAGKMIEKAAKVGILIECEYVEVIIGNQKVLIDPLRIVGF